MVDDSRGVSNLDAINNLTETIKRDGLDRRGESNRVLAVGVALLVLLVLNVAVLLQNRSRSLQNGEILKNSAATSEYIADCTTPGRACYQENLANQASLLTRLLTSEAFIAQCTKVTNTDGELETCVNERLKAAGLGLQLDLSSAPPTTGPSSPEPDPEPTPSEAQDSDVTP